MKEEKIIIIKFVFALIALLFVLKLFYIQVIDSSYKEEANNNVLNRVIEYPYRGVIKDRNGKLLVANTGVFDLMVIPSKLKLNGDVNKLCQLLDISRLDFDSIFAKCKKYSKVKPSIFLEQMSEIKFAKIQDMMADFPGFYVQYRTVRDYPDSLCANALGYIGEISKAKIELVGKENYQSGDMIGISGIESFYETQLRGKRGVNYLLVNVRGVEKGRFKNGLFDTASVPGLDLTSTLDLELQKYAEKLMANKVGSLVAIEPSTGEILAYVSTPTYNPNRLRGEDFSKNYSMLVKDPLKPLFNRPLMAMYPPGSIFKTINGLYALNEHLIDTNTVIACNRGIINCHGKHRSANFNTSIQFSCNPYYWQVYKKILTRGLDSTKKFNSTKPSYDRWWEFVKTFGIGSKLGVDLPNEKKGIFPSSNYFDKIYGVNRWAFSTVYSLGIGQGEMSLTPLQMANSACIFANRGHYYIPHLIKGIGNSNKPLPEYTVKYTPPVDPIFYTPLVNGMEAVVRAGTGYLANAKDMKICGKTGTVENPHGCDHSVFIGFAPMNNPKIAIAVVIENSGFGAEWAAPISGLCMAKYLNYKIKKDWVENYILQRNFITMPCKPGKRK